MQEIMVGRMKLSDLVKGYKLRLKYDGKKEKVNIVHGKLDNIFNGFYSSGDVYLGTHYDAAFEPGAVITNKQDIIDMLLHNLIRKYRLFLRGGEIAGFPGPVGNIMAACDKKVIKAMKQEIIDMIEKEIIDSE